MRLASLLLMSLSVSVSASRMDSSSSNPLSTINRAGGYGHVDVSLEAGRYEPHSAHQWGTLAETGVTHFTYDPYDLEAGPSKWAENFGTAPAQCNGKSQSPVRLPARVVLPMQTQPSNQLQTLMPFYGNDIPINTLTLRNTGHALQVDMPTNLRLAGGALGPNPYDVVQMHMHGRSEHSIAGAHYPLEIHIVHKDPARAANDPRLLAVVGIMVEESASDIPNAALEPLTALLPNFDTQFNNIGGNATIGKLFNLGLLLPQNLDYYHYNGSLTTPPCSEQVVWHVLSTPIQASRAQILSLLRPFGGVGNSRPTQLLNGRSVVVTSFQTPAPYAASATALANGRNINGVGQEATMSWLTMSLVGIMTWFGASMQ